MTTETTDSAPAAHSLQHYDVGLYKAVSRWCAQGIFRRKDVAETLIVRSCEESCGVRTALISHCQKRTVKRVSVPYSGGPIDDGKATSPWDVPLPAQEPFGEGKWRIVVPGSEEVHACAGGCSGSGQTRCPGCGGAKRTTCKALFCSSGRCSNCLYGKVSCNSCGGVGRRSCTACGGTGRRTDYTASGSSVSNCWSCSGGQVTCTSCGGTGRANCNYCHGTGQCSTCHGAGKVTCGKCGGRGHVTCGTCRGHGKLKTYDSMDASAFNISTCRTERFLDLPAKLAASASGTVTKELEAKLLSLPGHPEISIDSSIGALREMQEETSQKIPAGARVVRQKYTETEVAVRRLRYTYGSSDRELWVYGVDETVHAPGFPLDWGRLVLAALAVAVVVGTLLLLVKA